MNDGANERRKPRTFLWVVVVVVAIVLAIPLGGAAVVVIGTVAPAELTERRVRAAADAGCKSMIRRGGTVDDEAESEFVRAARLAGAHLLSHQQYAFRVDATPERLHCGFKVAWRSETPVFAFGNLFGLPPIKRTHRIDDAVDVER